MPTKKDLLIDLLSRAWVFVQLDGNAPGVDLPDDVRAPDVRLHIGYNMPVPIPDLTVDDFGVSATLSFRRTPHACRIPWNAIYLLFDGEETLLLFPEHVPEPLRAQLLANIDPSAVREVELTETPADKGATAGGATASAATEAKGEAAPQPTPPDDTPRLKSGKPRPSHLKLV